MFIIQGKEKQRIQKGFWPMSRFIFRFETQNINTSREIFYSFIPMINETTDMEMQSKCILRQFWNTLAEYFWNTGSKIRSFVMYLSWHQNTLEWINSPPYPHHFALSAHWYINFLNSPIIQYFEISIPPLPSVTGGFKLWDCSFHWWARARERKTWFVDLTSRPLIHKGLFI